MIRTPSLSRLSLSAAALLLLSAVTLPAAAQTAPPAVVSEILTAKSANFRAFPGVIRASREINLAFLVTGQVAERPISLGDRVEAGALIATLDQTSLAEDADAARAAARAAEAQAEIAAQSLTRTTALHERGIAPTSRLEAARAAADTTAAAAAAARATVTRAEDAATYARLTAPEAGIITTIMADPGATVQAGQPIATLATAEAREAVIDVPSAYLPLFTPQTRLAITSRTGDERPHYGRVRLIEPVADPRARMHRMRITLEDDAFRLGALVSVSIEGQETGEGMSLLSLPRAALMQEGESTKVWRVTPQRSLEAVEVILGPEIDGRVIIEQGLLEGDEILTRGINTATQGQTVGARIEQ